MILCIEKIGMFSFFGMNIAYNIGDIELTIGGYSMKQYEEVYQSKLVSVEEALGSIKDNDCIASGMCAMEPMTLLGNLHELHGKVRNINVLTGLVVGIHPFMQEEQYKDTFIIDDAFFMGNARNSHKKNITSYSPCNLHSFAQRRFAHITPNVALISVTPMDEHGYMTTSLCAIYEQELVEKADIVITEVNPNLPRVYGDTQIHINDIDYIVEVDTQIPQLQKGEVSDTDRKIGEFIASLVEDGDTIQLGIGGIPDAVAQALMGKKDLGVHTEMITNSIVDLVNAGVITGKRKTLHPGKIIGTFALGNQNLYDMVANNPAVEIHRSCYVNDPEIIAKNDNMVSINTCVAVDLTGQVASETIGSLQYSGSGGQSDTAYGAIHAKNGRSIIALQSTAKKGTISTISAMLPMGSVVTLSRNNIDYIVTEFGVAKMKGRSVRERVENLIQIAHPSFRDALREDAKKYLLW